MYYFYSIVKKNKVKRAIIRKKEAVSVVVVIRDDLEWVENILPIILSQNSNDFEVIAIDTGEDIRISEALAPLAKLYSHLTLTRFTHNPKFPISNKMAYNVGIKSAKTNNILITTTKSRPLSEFWVSEFAEEFTKSDIILGYAGVERTKNNFTTKSMRITRMLSAMRYFSSARSGKPYRGFINNFGLRKDIYFTANGFNFLNLNIGENDLFLQKIATKSNTSVLLSNNASVVESLHGSRTSHRIARRYFDHTYKFYSNKLKFSILFERLTRMLFFITALSAVVLLPLMLKLIAVGVVFVRFITVMTSIKIIAKRFKETKIMSAFPLHDIASPIENLIMYLHRKIKPMKNIWR